MSIRTTAIAALALLAVVPATASAAPVDISIPFAHGVHQKTVGYRVRHGHAHVTVRIRNDGTRVRLLVTRTGWAHPQLLIDTSAYACQGEMGHSVCEGDYDLPNGRYRFVVRKITARASVVDLRISG